MSTLWESLRNTKRQAHVFAGNATVFLRHNWKAIRNQSLTDAICAIMLRDKDPRRVTVADKIAVREFVADRIGTNFLARQYWAGREPNEIPWAQLPQEFVVKVSHASGGIIIVTESARETTVLPQPSNPQAWNRFRVSPSNFDTRTAIQLLRQWTEQQYRGHAAIREWVYTQIEPRVLVEEYLDSANGELSDYKFFMINGKCELIQLDSTRFTAHQRNLYTPDWELMSVTMEHEQVSGSVDRPQTLPQMLDVASTLAAGFDFMRVDLYSVGDRVVFGEMTNYPGGGHERFSDPNFDRLLGRKLRTKR